MSVCDCSRDLPLLTTGCGTVISMGVYVFIVWDKVSGARSGRWGV